MIDLLDLEWEDLQKLLADWGQPSYRTKQLWKWLYTNLVSSPDDMTNLPHDLRQRLGEETSAGCLTEIASQESRDLQTVKWLFELASHLDASQQRDAAGAPQIETVLMSYRDRRTACISSQAGCGIGCSFCATGQMGLQRNLTSGEIIAQVLHVARILAQQEARLTNVVLMGMGEPLANYDATIAAVRRLTDSFGFNFGQRRITVSTVGLVPGIKRFTQEDLQVGLAVSLHAATDDLRSRLVPINQRYPLDELFAACREYVAQTKRRISFEWALIAGTNDGLDQARTLAERIQGMLCHVNLIPLNPTSAFSGRPAHSAQVQAFSDELSRHGIPNTVRVRRGIDIQAGCGQLRRRHAESQ
jgi:23S rRNA (adenine2503-C2)-methyltransferase